MQSLLKKKEAKDLASSFKSKYGRLPSFKELWSLADKVVLQKTEGEDVSIEDKISAKMQKMKESQLMKETRKKELAECRNTWAGFPFQPRAAPASM